jgi:hypothetical protein
LILCGTITLGEEVREGITVLFSHPSEHFKMLITPYSTTPSIAEPLDLALSL